MSDATAASAALRLGGKANPQTLGGARTLLARSCKTCHQFKQADAFYRRSWGYESDCIPCYRAKRDKLRPRVRPVRCGAKGILIAQTCYQCGGLKAFDDFPEHRDRGRGDRQTVCFGCSYARLGVALQEAVADTRSQARRNGYQWTGPELEIVAREDLTVKQAALMLGRTFYAVETQRKKLRSGDPKTTRLAGV